MKMEVLSLFIPMKILIAQKALKKGVLAVHEMLAVLFTLFKAPVADRHS
jgi:hypothetical protein